MEGWFPLGHESVLARVALIAVIAVAAHVIVRLVQRLGARLMAGGLARRVTKARTVVSLASSTLVFVVYFAALGAILSEVGIALTAYFASATIIGLAVGFGSQGVVQDVVTGLTVILTDLFDVGDTVEIAGQTGIVQRFGIRFTVLRNPLGAEVFIPNRNIVSVINYPRGYVRALVDVLVPDPAKAAAMNEAAVRLTREIVEQVPGIVLAPPEVMGPQTTSTGRTYLRIKFRIWPNRGGPLETLFRQEMIQAMRAIEPALADWMVTVNYEVEAYTLPRRSRVR